MIGLERYKREGVLGWGKIITLEKLNLHSWTALLLQCLKHKHIVEVAEIIFIRKKSIFDHPTITRVRFWPSNSKTGYFWPSNYQNHLYLAIWLFWRVVLLRWHADMDKLAYVACINLSTRQNTLKPNIFAFYFQYLYSLFVWCGQPTCHSLSLPYQHPCKAPRHQNHHSKPPMGLFRRFWIVQDGQYPVL